MSDEVRTAIDKAITDFILILIPVLGAMGWSISQWIKERGRRRLAEGELIVRRGTTDVEREELLNDFTQDCLKRVSQLASELHEMQTQMRDQEAAHEQDRTRWINERNAMQARIDALERMVHEMQDERAEREIVVHEQSVTIRNLQERVSRQERLIAQLAAKDDGYANQL